MKKVLSAIFNFLVAVGEQRAKYVKSRYSKIY
jgi:hypothetical protein